MRLSTLSFFACTALVLLSPSLLTLSCQAVAAVACLAQLVLSYRGIE